MTIRESLLSETDQDMRLAMAIGQADPFQHKIPLDVNSLDFEPFTCGRSYLRSAAHYVEVRILDVPASELELAPVEG